ncbi:hypothetical protein EYZ11_003311 [Aspergillus tanneri]|uniref:Xylanolytic transcriptional activator regulatory domain-containing protein n=1 Tax=Aspergillus tanneri TaxID=1220188 RepID=A0A4S3JNN8_9EURO|nr:hypothetical protein EYZ11_003311 [Aspergillus tanneri]
MVDRIAYCEGNCHEKTGPSLPSSGSRTLYPRHVVYSAYPFLEFHGEKALDQDDMAYLAAKGCLSLPDKTVIEEFVKAYFLHIHPAMPIADEAEFWEIFYMRDEKTPRRLSLFLFQVILFASAPYVALEVLQKCGFDDRRSARNTLYQRAKLLFHLKAEDRPFIQAQGAVLLTLHTTADEPQAGSLWLARAIQAVMVLGCKPAPSEDTQGAMKKRLWWSIILRDRSLCLGLRRRPQVTSIDFSMDVEPLEEEDFTEEIDNSQVYDPRTKRLLFKALQEQCRLAVLLTEMVSFVFASHGLSTPRLSCEEFRESLARVSRIKATLKQWETCSNMSTWMKEDLPEAVNLFVNFTLMYYHTARIDLAHYEALLVENHIIWSGSNYISQLVETGTALHDAMDHLMSIMEYFSREGQAQNLPLSVLAYVSMPLVLTAIDLKLSPSSVEMASRRRRLDALGEIIRHSGRAYDVTDFISNGTNHLLHLAYLTSQHFFRCWDRDTPSTAAGSEAIAARHRERSQRANGWYDAFLRCPRAYLLISTSVDYSFSVGRLPTDNALPELVRCIPPIGIGIRLPWTVDVGERVSDRIQAVTPSSGDGEIARLLTLPGSTDHDSVNLDYLYLDVPSMDSTSSTTMHLVDKGAEEDGSVDSDFVVNAQWQLDYAAQTFDPWITSVDEYSSPILGEAIALD